jgi:hydroxymethylbilane synthase
MTQTRRIVIGTRRSPLALAQAEWVAQRLRELHAGLTVELKTITTSGDRHREGMLHEAGGKGLFVKELETALQSGEADVAVHSMKDVPSVLPPGMAIAAVPPREDPRDAWIGRDHALLSQLPAGATVGTASLRRQGQLKALRPDLRFTVLRGNIETRIAKVERGSCEATVLALAGLRRGGLADRADAVFALEQIVPAAGQAALALEVRADDDQTRQLVRGLDDAVSHAAVRAERFLVAALGATCTTPIGAYARIEAGRLHLRARLADPETGELLERDSAGAVGEAELVARRLAAELLEAGAAAFLAR